MTSGNGEGGTGTMEDFGFDGLPFLRMFLPNDPRRIFLAETTELGEREVATNAAMQTIDDVENFMVTMIMICRFSKVDLS